MYQDPKNGYEEGQPLDKDGVDRLTSLCVDKIIDDRGPLMETVRMQVNILIEIFKKLFNHITKNKLELEYLNANYRYNMKITMHHMRKSF